MSDSLRSPKKWQLWLNWGLLVLSPFWLLAVLSLILGRSAFSASPVWADEVELWRALFSWSRAGLQTGANGAFEIAADWGNLGLNGITPILLYGGFVKLFGLSAQSILLCNALWISLGALAFCLIRKPRPSVCLLMTGLFVLYVPVLLYCTTSMLEMFAYALVLFYLAFLFCYHESRKTWALVCCGVTLTVGCFYHPLFALLLLPAALVAARFRSGKGMALSVSCAALLAAVCLFVRDRITARYASSFLYQLSGASNASVWFQMVLSHGKVNLLDCFASKGSVIENLFFALYLLTALVCLLGALLPLGRLTNGFRKNLFGCFLMLLAAFGLTCAFYEIRDWRGLRTLAPFLWLVLVYLAARRRFWLPSFGVAASAAMAVVLLLTPPVGAFQEEGRYQAVSSDPALSRAIREIRYDAAAGDPFANTVRTDASRLMQFARELDPAIGVQSGWFSTDTTGRSRWILTDQLKCVLNGYECVADTDGYKVYRLMENK